MKWEKDLGSARDDESAGMLQQIDSGRWPDRFLKMPGHPWTDATRRPASPPRVWSADPLLVDAAYPRGLSGARERGCSRNRVEQGPRVNDLRPLIPTF